MRVNKKGVERKGPTHKSNPCLSSTIKLVLLMMLGLSLWVLPVTGQVSSTDFERIKLMDSDQILSGLAISPDGTMLAITSKQSSVVKIIDSKTRKVMKEINAGGWNPGSKINYSQNGKYLLLQELKRIDFSLNTDRNIGFELVDAVSGRQIKLFEKVQDVVITQDEKFAISLSDDEVTFWNLPEGSKDKSFKVNNAANAISISPNGQILAVSRSVSKEEIENDSRFFKRKKELKIAVRKGFTSVTNHEPDIRFSHDGKIFALNSKGNKFQEIHLYDFESGELHQRFELGHRLFEKADGEKVISHNRPSVIFLPGDQSVLIAIGNQTIMWKINSNQ